MSEVGKSFVNQVPSWHVSWSK